VLILAMLWPASASGKIDWMNATPQARRAALRQAHRQTVLVAPGRQYQHYLDREQLPTAHGRVVVTVAPNATPGQGEGGQSYPGNGQENIVLQPSSVTPARQTFDHEMGHAVWRQNLSDAQRQRIIALMGSKRAAYDGGPNPPGERAAEIYRVLAEKGGTLKSRAAYHKMAANESVGYMSHLPHYYQMRKIQQVLLDAAR
jgi:hypothetical protein